MDIVYIIGKRKSDADNFELRCSLRSIAKYGINVNKVFIVGCVPDFVSDEVIGIPFEQPYPGDTCDEKGANIMASVVRAAMDPRVGDHFLVSMDDHFYTDYTDFDNYPIYLRKYTWGTGTHRTQLPDTHSNDLPEYTKFLVDSCLRLKERNLPTYNFILHRNMHIWKETILDNINDVTNMIKTCKPIEVFAYAGNVALSKHIIDIDNCIMDTDKKLNNGVIEWWKTNSEYGVFSTPNFEKGSCLHILLKGRYPDKCKYEK